MLMLRTALKRWHIICSSCLEKGYNRKLIEPVFPTHRSAFEHSKPIEYVLSLTRLVTKCSKARNSDRSKLLLRELQFQ